MKVRWESEALIDAEMDDPRLYMRDVFGPDEKVCVCDREEDVVGVSTRKYGVATAVVMVFVMTYPLPPSLRA